jgi:hypothetical protein
MSRYGG